MKLYKVKLMSKHSKKNNWYVYTAILFDGNKYYHGYPIELISTKRISNFKVSDFIIGKEIKKELYELNGINK